MRAAPAGAECEAELDLLESELARTSDQEQADVLRRTDLAE